MMVTMPAAGVDLDAYELNNSISWLLQVRGTPI
jgi:hypothetical protein